MRCWNGSACSTRSHAHRAKVSIACVNWKPNMLETMNTGFSAFYAVLMRHGIVLFAAFLLFAGSMSIFLGQEIGFDLRNYHYYNPWALLHGRLNVDIAPAQLQTSLNPLLDIPVYLLI